VSVEPEELKQVPSLGDRYVCLERLGSGGMGVVYAVHDKQPDRKVAVKDSWPRRS
jgi:hypothetical protein